MEANADVFLVDHAWTFKHRTIYKELNQNDKLIERLENMFKYPAKKDMPLVNPYTKARPSLQEYLKQ
jgi:hypothetical protein